MKKIELKKYFAGICFSVILFLGGCGYTTSCVMSYGGASSIYVDAFINKINLTEQPTDRRMYVAYQSGMELDITRDTIDKFVRDGNLKIEPKDKADMILEGFLVDFIKEGMRYDGANNVIEYRIKVVVNIKLYRREDNEVFWEEKRFTGEHIYNVSGSYAESEDSAVQKAIDDLARRIVERTTENW